MTTAEKKTLINILCDLGQACDSLTNICSDLIDSKDGRVIDAREAVERARVRTNTLKNLLLP